MIKMELGPIPGSLALVGVLAIMIIILAVLALVVVKALTASPWGLFTIAATIPIALLMGLYMRVIRPGHVAEASAIGVVLLLVSLWWPTGVLAALSFFLFGVGPKIWTISSSTLRQTATPVAVLGQGVGDLPHSEHRRAAARRRTRRPDRRHLGRAGRPGRRGNRVWGAGGHHHVLARADVAAVSGGGGVGERRRRGMLGTRDRATVLDFALLVCVGPPGTSRCGRQPRRRGDVAADATARRRIHALMEGFRSSGNPR